MRFLSVCRLIAVCLLMAVIWQVQAWRYGAQIERLSATQTQATLQQQRAEQARRVALEQQLSTSDTQHARELSDAHHHQAVLRDRLVTAEVRLSVLLDAFSDCSVPAGTPPGGVVHATPRARLYPAHAQRIIGITDDGDNALIALRACQAYVRASPASFLRQSVTCACDWLL